MHLYFIILSIAGSHSFNQTQEYHQKSILDTDDMHNMQFVRDMHLAETW
jgi:hypothetical protein